MHFLNELYTIFDDLVDIHDLYKLDTVGDCYIVVAGLTMQDEDGFTCTVAGDHESRLQNAQVRYGPAVRPGGTVRSRVWGARGRAGREGGMVVMAACGLWPVALEFGGSRRADRRHRGFRARCVIAGWGVVGTSHPAALLHASCLHSLPGLALSLAWASVASALALQRDGVASLPLI